MGNVFAKKCFLGDSVPEVRIKCDPLYTHAFVGVNYKITPASPCNSKVDPVFESSTDVPFSVLAVHLHFLQRKFHLHRHLRDLHETY